MCVLDIIEKLPPKLTIAVSKACFVASFIVINLLMTSSWATINHEAWIDSKYIQSIMAIIGFKRTFEMQVFFYSLPWWVDNTFDMQSTITYALFLTCHFDTCASKASNLLLKVLDIFLPTQTLPLVCSFSPIYLILMVYGMLDTYPALTCLLILSPNLLLAI